MNKSTFRKEKIPFSMIPNALIQDSELSAIAKSVYCYLASRPDNWMFYNVEIINNFKEGRTAVLRGIKELENIGWLSSKQLKENGRFAHKEYTLHYEKPITENTSSEKLDSEMRTHNNNDYTNNDLNKNKNNKNNILSDDKMNEIFNLFSVYQNGMSSHSGKNYNLSFKTHGKAFSSLLSKIRELKKDEVDIDKFVYVCGNLVTAFYSQMKNGGAINICRISVHANKIEEIIDCYRNGYLEFNEIKED